MKIIWKLQFFGGFGAGGVACRIALKMIGVCLLFAMCLGNPGFAQEEANIDNMTSEELLEFLIVKNEEGWKKIKTLQYEIIWGGERRADGGMLMNTGEGLAIRKGRHRNVSFSRREGGIGTDGIRNVSGKSVLNDHYMAFWYSLEPSQVEQHFHKSIDQMDRLSQGTYEALAYPVEFEFFRYCFGGSAAQPLRETLRLAHKFHDTLKLEASRIKSEPDQRILYSISMYNPNFVDDPKDPFKTWTIDPTQGYAITSIKAFQRDGRSLSSEVNVHCKEVGNEIWFPESFHHTGYIYGTRELDYSINIFCLNIRINDIIEASQFELEAMQQQLPEDANTLVRREVGGNYVEHRLQ